MNPVDLNVSWDNIGGLDDIIDELQELVVLPFTRPDIFLGKSQLLKPPKGMRCHHDMLDLGQTARCVSPNAYRQNTLPHMAVALTSRCFQRIADFCRESCLPIALMSNSYFAYRRAAVW